MAPVLFIFTDNPVTEKQSIWVKNCKNAGYEPFIETYYKNNYDWLCSNFIYEHCFYSITSTVTDFSKHHLDRDMIITPDIAIAFNKDQTVSKEEWKILYDFISHIAFEIPYNEKEVFRILTPPVIVKPIIENEPEKNHYQDHYSLETRFIEEHDTMLYQVTKPFTDLPYTTLTREYSKKGHLPFFTSLFICQSWGVSNKDIAFLKKVWEDFKMSGEFNIDILLKERTEMCYPSSGIAPEPEPIVYRRCIEDVLYTLQKKRDGNII